MPVERHMRVEGSILSQYPGVASRVVFATPHIGVPSLNKLDNICRLLDPVWRNSTAANDERS